MRLGDLDALKETFNKDIERFGDIPWHISAIETEIDAMPTIDAIPVVHGRWVQVVCHEEFEDGFVDRLYEYCSRCHEPNGRSTSNYCPNCGAKMDLED